MRRDFSQIFIRDWSRRLVFLRGCESVLQRTEDLGVGVTRGFGLGEVRFDLFDQRVDGGGQLAGLLGGGFEFGDLRSRAARRGDQEHDETRDGDHGDKPAALRRDS
ncbi:MAG: hypothetical protein AAF663_00765 [Planctomycetota bacterium]